jgi:hypothetical protein
MLLTAHRRTHASPASSSYEQQHGPPAYSTVPTTPCRKEHCCGLLSPLSSFSLVLLLLFTSLKAFDESPCPSQFSVRVRCLLPEQIVILLRPADPSPTPPPSASLVPAGDPRRRSISPENEKEEDRKERRERSSTTVRG